VYQLDGKIGSMNIFFDGSGNASSHAEYFSGWYFLMNPGMDFTADPLISMF